jgi:hypothetical protein
MRNFNNDRRFNNLKTDAQRLGLILARDRQTRVYSVRMPGQSAGFQAMDLNRCERYLRGAKVAIMVAREVAKLA